MPLKREEAKDLAIAIAKKFGEAVAVIGSCQDDCPEIQEFVNPDGSSILGLLEPGVGNCRFMEVPLDLLNTSACKWSIGWRGRRFSNLLDIIVFAAQTPLEHGWYPSTKFDPLNEDACTCGERPHVYVVLKEDHIQAQLRCPKCGKEGPIEPLEGDAVDQWNESLK